MRPLRYLSIEGHITAERKRMDPYTFIIALALMFVVYIIIRLLMRR